MKSVRHGVRKGRQVNEWLGVVTQTGDGYPMLRICIMWWNPPCGGTGDIRQWFGLAVAGLDH